MSRENDAYHQVHYTMFHSMLPEAIRGDMREMFLDAVRKGEGAHILIGLWRGIAKSIVGSPLPSFLDLSASDFTVVAIPTQSSSVLILVTGPEVRGPLEAAHVAILIDETNPSADVKYLACEAPAIDGGPWMIGGWSGPGMHSNFGGIRNSDARTFLRCVSELLDLDIDDENSILDESGTSTESSILNWETQAIDIAMQVVDVLATEFTESGEGVILAAETTAGAVEPASTYLQIFWDFENSGDLLVEIQGDYSYWGLAVPSSLWPQLLEVGMHRPNAENPNFHCRIPASTSPRDTADWIIRLFETFVEIFRPVGIVQLSMV